MSSGKIPFSKRTAWDLAQTPLAQALRQRRAACQPIADLTASNPTRCDFQYEAHTVLAALTDERALQYDPDPRGLLSAREAVCGYYADLGVTVTPEQIFLTTSTSEGYSFLFRLLCDPGDEVLIAQPSYPLFDFIADLDDIRLTPYELIYDHGWQLDVNTLKEGITPRTRAIAVVHPNNPTGHFIKDWEREAIEAICLDHGLAFIVDEVFRDYSHQDGGSGLNDKSFAAGRQSALTFVLSGLSKIAGLPQMKAAWIVCLGPRLLQVEAQNRLEIIADTFLSMNAPVQGGLPTWLAGRHKIQRQIHDRTTANLARLDQLLGDQLNISRLSVEAGWYAILRIPALDPDERAALRLLDAGVLVHPGSYFGLPPSGWLVISLLTPENEFQTGAELLTRSLNS